MTLKHSKSYKMFGFDSTANHTWINFNSLNKIRCQNICNTISSYKTYHDLNISILNI